MGTDEKRDPGSQLEPAEIISLEEKYLFPTYKRYDLFISHGLGAYVYDMQGRRYLDFLAGIAVNSLGYNHPRLVRVMMEQAQRLMHCSNFFYHPYQGLLAKRLVELSGLSKVFFTNSGTEAVEGALKIARAYGHRHRTAGKTGILALKNSFHGRTMGALSITAQEKYQAPFRPLISDVGIVGAPEVSILREAFHDRICALVLEPVQGEAGVVPLAAEFLTAARDLCDRHEALLILDEVQCGMGRTGKFFAFQHSGVTPDVVTLAKPLAGGYPMGAILGGSRVAATLEPGDHGTTFGGGPLACRLALEVLDIMEDESLLPRVVELGAYLTEGLRGLARRHPAMGEIRSLGLMVGIDLGNRAREVVQRLLSQGVLANVAHDSVLRLLPPFVIERADIALFLETLDRILTDLEAESPVGGSAGQASEA